MVANDAAEHRFYTDMAEWWPLLSAPEDYREEAAEAARHLRAASIPVRDVLELGSGGGNNAVAPQGRVRDDPRRSERGDARGVASAQPRAARTTRATCARSASVRTFDAVFVHDAVCYMLNEDDLRAALATAFEHCRPGGVAVVIPDETAETFEPDDDHGGEDGDDGRAARYLMWTWDPDADDGVTSTEFAFLLRDVDGHVDAVHETHLNGLFAHDTWLRLLADVGFEPAAVTEATTDDRRPRTIFLGHRRPAVADR